MDPTANVPPTLWALFATVVLSLLSILSWFIRGVKADQAKIATTLENHLGSLSANQARIAEHLDLITNKLLDAAINAASTRKAVLKAINGNKKKRSG